MAPSKDRVKSGKYNYIVEEKNVFHNLSDSITESLGYYAVNAASMVGSSIYSVYEWGYSKVGYRQNGGDAMI